MASLLCSKCLKIKDEALFYRDIKLKRGFSYYCKDCECARRRKDSPTPQKKRDSIERKNYLRDYYLKNRNPNAQRRTRGVTKEQRKVHKALYYLENKERYQERYRKNYYTEHGRNISRINSHKRRCRNKTVENNLTENDIGFLLCFQDNKCACCDIIFTKDRNYTIDHIIPLVKGGGLCLENVQLLCTHCNCSKGIKEIQYRPDINYLVKE